MTETPLKLKAINVEDLMVISAILQDSIAPVCDMLFKADDKNFIMVVHRLCRENEEQENLERVCCAVNIQGVIKAQLQGVDLSNQDQMLELLALMPGEGEVTFIFAGNAKIRLKLKDWAMVVEDFGNSWPAQCNPCHDSDSKAG